MVFDEESAIFLGSYYQEDYLIGLMLNFSNPLKTNGSSSLSSSSSSSSSAPSTVLEEVPMPMTDDEYLANVNDIVDEFRRGMFAYKDPRNISLVSIYLPLFLLATFSNLLVVTVVFRYRRFRSATNYFLVNLSVADLMVTLICMPMAVATNLHRSWIYGYFMCKLTTYMEGVAVSASVFTLTAMSVDRYVAIRHPMIFRKRFTRTLVLKVIAGVWIMSLTLFVPVLFVRRTEGYFLTSPEPRFSFVFCVERWSDEDGRRLYSAFLFAIVYAIPGHVIVAAYCMIGCTLRAGHHLSSSSVYSSKDAALKLIKGRRKVARIMLVLALIFAFCWLPYNIVLLVLDTSSNYNVRQCCLAILPFSLLVGHSNSAINLILYCFLAKSFRAGVRETIRTCCRRANPSGEGPPPPPPPPTMPTREKCSPKYKQRSRLDNVSSSNDKMPCLPCRNYNRFRASSDFAAASASFDSTDRPTRCCLVKTSSSATENKRSVLVVVTNVAVSALMNSLSNSQEEDNKANGLCKTLETSNLQVFAIRHNRSAVVCLNT